MNVSKTILLCVATFLMIACIVYMFLTIAFPYDEELHRIAVENEKK